VNLGLALVLGAIGLVVLGLGFVFVLGFVDGYRRRRRPWWRADVPAGRRDH
jgi:hypothetical protein